MLLGPGPLALFFVALASLLFFVPFSLQVSLGQDYLPNNMGTAAGVTLGLAVSAGGVASPVVGAVADNFGLLNALLPLVIFPAAACVLLTRMRDPRL
jgi:FSR family fosmidomycin resistance protein-like MFS transporter